MTVETIKTEKRLTISDIAAMAGVSKAAVSGVLNKKSRVGQATEKKILSIIKKYNYVPQDSARALSTKRTYQIGYLVSSQVTLGLANSTFATYLAGVGDCCQQRGYRMMASSYDMTKVENFLIVEKLRQRCVDGLILTGLFDSKIIDNLRSLKIPIIFIGGNEQEGILCLRSNMHQTYLKMLDYLTENEHRKIFFASNLDYVRQVFKEAVDEFTITSPQLRTNFQYGENALNSNEFVNGRHYAEQWLKADKADRYTAFISNEQVCCGFLSEIIKNKVDCPGEISIFSNIDSFLCQANAIPISAPSSSLFERGKLAADLLIDLLEGQKTSKQIKKVLKQEYKTHELIIRSTTGKAPQNNN